MGAPAPRGPVHEALVSRIAAGGPVPFRDVMELALYHPTGGFFTGGAGAPGRRGDFITSPEVGPLFGAVVARALAGWWHDLGEPDPFVVIDAGAGPGTLAVSIAAAKPDFLPALTYVLVERSPVLRERHGDHLDVVEATDDLLVPAERGSGPRFVSIADLADRPAGPLDGVVIANELLDDLPVDLLERRVDGWYEVRVGVGEDGTTLVEQLVPAEEPLAAVAGELAPAARPGARIPLQRVAAGWLRTALGTIGRGRVVVVDYVSTTSELAERPIDEWLRTYRAHERGGALLADLGSKDITCEVCADQLERVRPADRTRTQAQFLRDHGIDELVEEGRRIWHERAHLGDLEAIRGRSRVNEAAALLEPTGLGAFTVLEWALPSRSGDQIAGGGSARGHQKR